MKIVKKLSSLFHLNNAELDRVTGGRSEPGSEDFACPYCGSTFPSLNVRETHIRICPMNPNAKKVKAGKRA